LATPARRLPFLKDKLATGEAPAQYAARNFRRGIMSIVFVQNVLSLAIGFASAGVIANAYQLLTARPLSFRLCNSAARATALAAVPLIIFGAPFIIVRNTIRNRCVPERRAELVAIATIVAGFWSLMSGTVVVMGLQALGLLAA
jgi:hypothetical protein